MSNEDPNKKLDEYFSKLKKEKSFPIEPDDEEPAGVLAGDPKKEPVPDTDKEDQ